MTTLTLPPIASDLSLLLIRIIVGIAFVIAARNKSRNVPKFAKQNGLPLPAGYAVMALEMGAGIAILLGVLTQFAALIIVLLMLGTLRLHILKWKSPYWAASGGWEYDLMLLAFAVVLVIQGGGQFGISSL